MFLSAVDLTTEPLIQFHPLFNSGSQPTGFNGRGLRTEIFMVHRKLSRTAEHRASLLRNLVTNVLEHESITTTHAKAKEAQTAVERVITAAKHLHARRGDLLREDFNRRTQLLQNNFYKPEELMPKLMNELRERYDKFQGGYTRVLKLEPRVGDMAPQSILELVGGKRDMRMAMTAKAVARAEAAGEEHPVTLKNVEKIVRIVGEERFRQEVDAMRLEYFSDSEPGAAAPYESKKRAAVEIKPNPLAK